MNNMWLTNRTYIIYKNEENILFDYRVDIYFYDDRYEQKCVYVWTVLGFQTWNYDIFGLYIRSDCQVRPHTLISQTSIYHKIYFLIWMNDIIADDDKNIINWINY